jgi:glycogen debranching enzyme
VWPWLIGAFVEAWLTVNGSTAATRAQARARFLQPLFAHLNTAGLGHVSEIADGAAPHAPRGCPWQAWSLSELLRVTAVVLAEPPPSPPTRLPAPRPSRRKRELVPV